MCTGYTSRENRRMKEKMPKCAVGTQRRHNPHIKVAAVAVVLFLQFHWQLGFACCSMWRMRNVCKSMKMLGNEEKLCCASCCEHFCCCCCFIFHLFFAQDFLDIFPFDFIWVIAQGICNWLQGVWVWVLHVFGQFECTLYVGVAR